MPEANTTPTPAAQATPAAGNAAPAADVVSKAAHDELAGRYGSTLQELEAAKKQLADFNAKAEQAKKAELEQKGEFQKLAEAEKARADKAESDRKAIEAKYEADTKKFQLGIAAKSAGITDVNDALALIDIGQLTVKDGKIEGIEPAIEKLKSEKPYLFGASAAPRPHGDRADPGKLTRADLVKDTRAAQELYEKNPQLFRQIMGTAG